MQSLNYLNCNELKCFAKVQGVCLLLASLLIIISHFFIYSEVSHHVQMVYVALFVVFLSVFFTSIFFGQKLKSHFDKLTIVIYTILSVAMLFVFFI